VSGGVGCIKELDVVVAEVDPTGEVVARPAMAPCKSAKVNVPPVAFVEDDGVVDGAEVVMVVLVVVVLVVVDVNADVDVGSV